MVRNDRCRAGCHQRVAERVSIFSVRSFRLIVSSVDPLVRSWPKHHGKPILWFAAGPSTMGREGRAMSKRSGAIFLRLKSTLKQTWRGSPTLRRRYSYSSLAKRVRLHAPRLGIGAPVCRGDLCSVCRCWDLHVAPHAKQQVLQVKHSLEAVAPSMWLNLTLDFEATGWSWDSPPVDCMEFYKIMTEYMNSHEPQADYDESTFQITKEVGIAEIVKGRSMSTISSWQLFPRLC